MNLVIIINYKYKYIVYIYIYIFDCVIFLYLFTGTIINGLAWILTYHTPSWRVSYLMLK